MLAGKFGRALSGIFGYATIFPLHLTPLNLLVKSLKVWIVEAHVFKQAPLA